MIDIITASHADIAAIEDILTDAASWLDSANMPLWRSEQIAWERLSRDFAPSDFRIALLDGKPAACMALVDHDPMFWPEVARGQSLFIHKLAVKRFAAGMGLSDRLMDCAKALCMDRGIPALRLDCHAHRHKLRAVYERNGFVCVREDTLFGRYATAFYACEVHDTRHLYHYYDGAHPPLRTITALPYGEALALLRRKQAADPASTHPDIEWFLKRRYEMERTVREAFIAKGGNPMTTAPVYCTLGANEHMKTWFDNPAVLRIPLSVLNVDAVSFTYGDMFAVFNPSLDTGEEWWGRVYRCAEMLRLIEKYGYPEDPEYDMKHRVFPKDKPINQYLKYVEAHVWDDGVSEWYKG